MRPVLLAALVGTCVSLGGFPARPTLAAQAQIKIIIHKDNEVSNLSKADLERIFLGEKNFWGGNRKIMPIVQSGPAKDGFYPLIGMSETDFRKQWIRTSLSGRGDPPKTFRSDEQVIAYVKGNQGSISFVSSTADTNAVKVLAVGDK